MRGRVGAFSHGPAPPPAVVDLSAIPVSGTFVPELAPFDEAVLALLRDEGIPGAALAVARQGRLVLSRGYGVLERGVPTSVAPDARFRIASIAKPITAVAALALIEDLGETRLLDVPVVPALGIEPWLRNARSLDARLGRITLRHILQHSAGWDRERTFDPMFRAAEAARDLSVPSPPSPKDIARWGMGFPLDFEPGSRVAYSNFGYCLAGRWIEALSGRPYERYVRERVLGRLGVPAMEIGREGRAGRLSGESAYHMPTSDPEPETPYVSIHPPLFDSHGGWVATAPDLVRFADRWDDSGMGSVSRAAAQWVRERPTAPLPRRKDGTPAMAWHGLGWLVRPVAQGTNLWHSGTMAGTSSIVVRLASGTTWALLTNHRAMADLDAVLHEAARRFHL